MSTPQNQVFVGTTQTNVITVNSPGPQGPTGPLGNPGPTGPGGGATGPTGPPGEALAPIYNQSVDAALPSGISDNFSPFGYVDGTTNMLELVPTDDTSTLAGISAIGVPNGYTLIIINLSPTFGIEFLHQSSGTPANQFNCPGGSEAGIDVFGTTILVYVTGQGWFFT